MNFIWYQSWEVSVVFNSRLCSCKWFVIICKANEVNICFFSEYSIFPINFNFLSNGWSTFRTCFSILLKLDSKGLNLSFFHFRYNSYSNFKSQLSLFSGLSISLEDNFRSYEIKSRLKISIRICVRMNRNNK